MITAAVRQQIASIISQPGSEQPLIERMCQMTGRRNSDEEIAGFVEHICSYIESTPDLIDACAGSAANAGIGHIVNPMLTAAAQYFLNPNDFIPDDLGLLGLMDDAYLAYRLMARVSAEYQRHTGVPLLPVNLEHANAIVRGIVGSPLADHLDQTVEEALQSAIMQSRVQQLAQHDGTLQFGDSATGGPGAWGGSWEDEMARLGAECGISINYD